MERREFFTKGGILAGILGFLGFSQRKVKAEPLIYDKIKTFETVPGWRVSLDDIDKNPGYRCAIVNIISARIHEFAKKNNIVVYRLPLYGNNIKETFMESYELLTAEKDIKKKILDIHNKGYDITYITLNLFAKPNIIRFRMKYTKQ